MGRKGTLVVVVTGMVPSIVQLYTFYKVYISIKVARIKYSITFFR